MKFDSIIFDLDGTLWDATNVTAYGWNNALGKLQLSEFEVSATQVKEVCGLPNSECIERIFSKIAGVNLTELEKLLDIEEEAAFDNCLAQLYPGNTEGIKILKESRRVFSEAIVRMSHLPFWQHARAIF